MGERKGIVQYPIACVIFYHLGLFFLFNLVEKFKKIIRDYVQGNIIILIISSFLFPAKGSAAPAVQFHKLWDVRPAGFLRLHLIQPPT